jgi:hypothetical protein
MGDTDRVGVAGALELCIAIISMLCRLLSEIFRSVLWLLADRRGFFSL